MQAGCTFEKKSSALKLLKELTRLKIHQKYTENPDISLPSDRSTQDSLKLFQQELNNKFKEDYLLKNNTIHDIKTEINKVQQLLNKDQIFNLQSNQISNIFISINNQIIHRNEEIQRELNNLKLSCADLNFMDMELIEKNNFHIRNSGVVRKPWTQRKFIYDKCLYQKRIITSNEELDYQHYLEKNGGHSGGWITKDHCVYLAEKKKNPQSFIKYLNKLLPGIII